MIHAALVADERNLCDSMRVVVRQAFTALPHAPERAQDLLLEYLELDKRHQEVLLTLNEYARSVE